MEMTKEYYREYIGKKIATLRKDHGLSQAKLGEIAELDPAHIGRIELGRYNVGIDTIGKIADALGYSVEFVKKENP